MKGYLKKVERSPNNGACLSVAFSEDVDLDPVLFEIKQDFAKLLAKGDTVYFEEDNGVNEIHQDYEVQVLFRWFGVGYDTVMVECSCQGSYQDNNPDHVD